ncbi:MAG: hypothetical protein WBE63_05520, partial [Acidobacteriaceae bacterium]
VTEEEAFSVQRSAFRKARRRRRGHLLRNRKGRSEAAFFFFYPISSGYHMERIRPPKYFEDIKVQVA